MDLNLHSTQKHHLPDWPAAASAGFAAGAVLMVLQLFWSVFVSDSSPWAVSHMTAAIVMGSATLQSSDFPWFVDWRGTETLLGHLIFGETAALLYWELNRQN